MSTSMTGDLKVSGYRHRVICRHWVIGHGSRRSSGLRSLIVALALALPLAGCRSQAPASEDTAAAGESHEGHTMARVFFVSPKDGDTIKTEHRFEFGSDQYQIAAVPEGEITADQVRPGVGHFHLGVNQDCVPAGMEIVRGQPDWIHFGTGSNFIDMPLKPGPYKFSVQVGDDLHRAVEGLCETINVTVAE